MTSVLLEYELISVDRLLLISAGCVVVPYRRIKALFRDVLHVRNRDWIRHLNVFIGVWHYDFVSALEKS